MWVVKFQFDGCKIFFGKVAKLFNIDLTGYPISSYEKNNQLYVNLIGTVKGDLSNKNKFIGFLKKSKYIKELEEKNNFFIILVKEDYIFKPFYNPSFIYISPVFIDHNGNYTYNLGSWDRKKIEKLLKFVDKNYNHKLITFKQQEIENVSILGIQPNLTKKQKRAYELAVKEGYYEYPKKIELKELAKILGVSYSTFQQHLKYAEKKIAYFFVSKY